MRESDIPDDPPDLAEPPIPASAIARQIAAYPRAAVAALSLLPRLDLSDLRAAIELESLAYGALQAGPEHRAWLAARERAALALAGEVRLARVDNVLSIELARPVAHNAIDRAMRDALFEGFTLAALDQDIQAVRLTGAGKAFCVGADLDEFGTTRDPDEAHAIRMQTLPTLAIINCLDKFEVHVQGACVGAGLEMAAFAHRLTASPNAWFQLPELAMGLIPGAGGCVSVSRRIGRRRAALLILSGRRISAQTALDWGLVDAIVDD